MFDRPHHQRIARVLEALDADLLRVARCYFGGGTAITMRYGEFRESVDIDLLVSDRAGYSDLRERVRRDGGINALTRQAVTELRTPMTDQYGIRTVVAVDGEPIKFEIVSEGRIDLDDPDSSDEICGVSTLTVLDMATSKLLANSDRWADTAVHSRDLIDLAMMQPERSLFASAIAKAETAYRSSVVTDLDKAIDYLRDNPHRLDDCMSALGMQIPKAVLWQQITDLGRS